MIEKKIKNMTELFQIFGEPEIRAYLIHHTKYTLDDFFSTEEDSVMSNILCALNFPVPGSRLEIIESGGNHLESLGWSAVGTNFILSNLVDAVIAAGGGKRKKNEKSIFENISLFYDEEVENKKIGQSRIKTGFVENETDIRQEDILARRRARAKNRIVKDVSVTKLSDLGKEEVN